LVRARFTSVRRFTASTARTSRGQSAVGRNVSSGCIRMRNADIIDLYERVKVGTKVVVL
jgi:lipoprotein-anchoring transpeptidase ErfK/SrfK